MKRTLTALLCALLASVTFAGCNSDSNPASPLPENGVIASGHPEWSPIMYRNGAVIDGAGPALVKKIFDDLAVPVSFPYAGAWDEVQAKARSGEVDVLVAAYKTTERETYMAYSDPYTTDPIAVFVAAGKAFPFETWDALIPKRGMATVGDSYGQAFDDFAAANLQITRVGTSAEAFDAVASGQADYFLYSLYAGGDELKRTGGTAKFESLPKFVNEENFYITISKKSPWLVYLPFINQRIARFKADGTVDRLIAQYKNR
jgi:polar amino acid transport system substrate-binding protein